MITYDRVKNLYKKLHTVDFNDLAEDDIDLLTKWNEYREEMPTYTPSDEELGVIGKLTGMPKTWMESATFKLFEPGKLLVRTSDAYWMCLMGREFLVDLGNKEAFLICEN